MLMRHWAAQAWEGHARSLEERSGAKGTLPARRENLGTMEGSKYNGAGLAGDYHLKGFPEFEQLYIAGFQARTQVGLESAASASSATPAWHCL